MKIRKWDKVEIISWKKEDKEKQAEVLKVFKDTNKILVSWINIVTKHVKKSWANPWQIVKFEKPIDVSNVKLICPFTWKPTRIWYVFVEEKGVNKKFRFSKNALKEKWWEAKKYIV